MKKLLTIMALAALLCLVCGVALASDSQNFDYTVVTRDGYTGIPTKIKVEGKDYILITTGYTGSSASAQCGKTITGLTYQLDGGSDLRILNLVHTHSPIPAVGNTAKYVHNKDNTITYQCTYTKCKANVTVATPADTAAGSYHIKADGTNAYIEKITTDPTCTETGVKATVCSVCGARKPGTQDETVSTIKHEPIIVVVTYPTCADEDSMDSGVITLSCKYCNKPVNTAGVVLDNPVYRYCKWNDGDATAAPSFNYYYCNTKFSPSPWPYEIHKWGNWSQYSAATCALDSTYDRSCPVCHASEKKTYFDLNWAHDNLGSNYVFVGAVQPDVKDCWTVELTFQCSICKGGKCGNIKVTVKNGAVDKADVADAAKKDFYLWHNTDKKTIGTDATAAELVDLSTVKNHMAVHTYELTNDWLVGEVEVSCASIGYKLYACKYCGETAAKHGGDLAAAKAAFTAGNINLKNYDDWCLRLVKTGDQLPHDYTGYTMTKKPDQANGVYGRWTRTCKVCGDTDEYVSYTAPSAICEHDFVKDEALSKAATCTEDGLAATICSKCGIAGESTVIPAAGHSAKAKLVETKKEATCEVAGEGVYYCDVCEKTFEAAIPAPGHKWDDGVITTPATYDKKGEKTFTCATCGETKKEEVEFVATETAKYDVKDAVYDGEAVSGKVEHDKNTKELTAAYARVTFFYADGTFAVMVVPVEDGEFYAGATTATVHVAVQIVDNAKQITPPATDAIYGNGSATMK